jgi:amidohydrolase
MDIKTKIKQLSDKYFDEVVAIRRHLHQNPELSFQEHETAKYITSKLDKIGIKYKSGIAGNGILAFIEGKNPTKKTIALRADIDALPVEEQNNLSYKSTNKGVMHACGHDAHTASMFGTIFILKALQDEFEGTILVIFQPAEEKLPGGAKLMIDEGVLENPKPELIIAQHVYPELTTGKVAFKSGTYMASADELYFTVKGKGGHAAIPDKMTNTVLTAAQIITELQEVPKQTPKDVPTVLTIGKVIANGATNVVPNEVHMEGTFRTMDETWRKDAHKRITEIANKIALNNGAKVDIEIRHGYPVLINNQETTQKAIYFAQEFLGDKNVEELQLRMTAEDFAYYSQVIPATFYRLGTSKNINDYKPLHSPNFNIDEEALKTGMETMAYIAYNFMT